MSKTLPVLCLLAGAICCPAQSTADRIASKIERPAIQFTPITPEQRFHLYLKRSFGPEAWLRTAFGAGYGQWRERPVEWREGSQAFGKRFASGFAEHFTETTLEYGASTLLHEDNRFFPSERTGFGSRVLYAVESPFVARRSDGTRRVSISHIGGIVGAAFISRAWQPESTRGAKSAEINAAGQIGASVGFDVLREFWPRKQ